MSDTLPSRHLLVTRDRVTRVLTCTAGILLLASLAGEVAKFGFGKWRVFGLVPLFDVGHEGNVPTLFSVLLLLACALLLALVAGAERPQGRRRMATWALWSVGFVYLAADEAFMLHERLVGPVTAWLGQDRAQLFPFAEVYIWVLPALAAVLAVGVFSWRTLATLPRATRRALLLAAGVYVTGAAGVETLGGLSLVLTGRWGLLQQLFSTLEEGLEMAGAILAIRALLTHLAALDITVRFTTGDPARTP